MLKTFPEMTVNAENGTAVDLLICQWITVQMLTSIVSFSTSHMAVVEGDWIFHRMEGGGGGDLAIHIRYACRLLGAWRIQLQDLRWVLWWYDSCSRIESSNRTPRLRGWIKPSISSMHTLLRAPFMQAASCCQALTHLIHSIYITSYHVPWKSFCSIYNTSNVHNIYRLCCFVHNTLVPWTGCNFVPRWLCNSIPLFLWPPLFHHAPLNVHCKSSVCNP